LALLRAALVTTFFAAGLALAPAPEIAFNALPMAFFARERSPPAADEDLVAAPFAVFFATAAFDFAEDSPFALARTSAACARL
jgi:hypothetical protein